jgi:hypothetical protein
MCVRAGRKWRRRRLECSPCRALEITFADKSLYCSICSGGKAKDYDPAQQQAQKKPPPFDPKLFTTEELRRMQEVMTMIAVRQGLLRSISASCSNRRSPKL